MISPSRATAAALLGTGNRLPGPTCNVLPEAVTMLIREKTTRIMTPAPTPIDMLLFGPTRGSGSYQPGSVGYTRRAAQCRFRKEGFVFDARVRQRRKSEVLQQTLNLAFHRGEVGVMAHR